MAGNGSCVSIDAFAVPLVGEAGFFDACVTLDLPGAGRSPVRDAVASSTVIVRDEDELVLCSADCMRTVSGGLSFVRFASLDAGLNLKLFASPS